MVLFSIVRFQPHPLKCRALGALISASSLALGCSSENHSATERASIANSARPADVSAEAEGFRGALDVMIHDAVDGSVDQQYFLGFSTRDRLQLVFESEPARIVYGSQLNLDDLSSGTPVSVWGKLVDRKLYVEHLQLTSKRVTLGNGIGQVHQAQLGQGSQAIGQGDKKVAVVLVGFSGTPNNYDVEQMRQAVYGTGQSTNTFYLAGSFGGSKLVGIENVEGGDVFGPYTVSGDGCSGGGGYDAAGTEARDMAQADGHDMDAYDKVVHYLPPNASGCPGGGVGGGRYAFIFGVGINSAWDYVAHEVGHTFGLPHAGSYTDCTSGTDVITYGGSCVHDEYGDLTDIMGGRNFQFSSHHLIRLGWLPEENQLTLEQSARVRLVPIETASTGIQSLYVNRSGNENYHFEYRQPLNVDERLEQDLTNGVLIRLTSGSSTTHLLDMTPNNDFRDATLKQGRTFTDDGLEVTAVEVSSEAAIIDVVIDGAPVDPSTVVGGDGEPIPGTGGMSGAGGSSGAGSGGSAGAAAGANAGAGAGAGGADTGGGGTPSGGSPAMAGNSAGGVAGGASATAGASGTVMAGGAANPTGGAAGSAAGGVAMPIGNAAGGAGTANVAGSEPALGGSGAATTATGTPATGANATARTSPPAAADPAGGCSTVVLADSRGLPASGPWGAAAMLIAGLWLRRRRFA